MRAGAITATIIAGVLTVALGLMFAVVAIGGGTSTLPGGLRACIPKGATLSGPNGQLSSAQLANAQIIVKTGKSMSVSRYGQVVAVAAAYQESKLRNLHRGHADSLGLFQQRASWGTAAQRMNPVYAARQFYEHLKQVPGWQDMKLAQAAQAVQRSAYPAAYAQWAGLAAKIVGKVAGIICKAATSLAALGDPCQQGDMATIEAAGQQVTVNEKLAGTFRSLIAQYARTVEPINTIGGYACRANVNSPGDMSRHAWGAAIDINAAQHPNGAAGTFTPRQERAIRAILNTHPNIRWGGNYDSTVDEMHFELYSGS